MVSSLADSSGISDFIAPKSSKPDRSEPRKSADKPFSDVLKEEKPSAKADDTDKDTAPKKTSRNQLHQVERQQPLGDEALTVEMTGEGEDPLLVTEGLEETALGGDLISSNAADISEISDLTADVAEAEIIAMPISDPAAANALEAELAELGATDDELLEDPSSLSAEELLNLAEDLADADQLQNSLSGNELNNAAAQSGTTAEGLASEASAQQSSDLAQQNLAAGQTTLGGAATSAQSAIASEETAEALPASAPITTQQAGNSNPAQADGAEAAQMADDKSPQPAMSENRSDGRDQDRRSSENKSDTDVFRTGTDPTVSRASVPQYNTATPVELSAQSTITGLSELGATPLEGLDSVIQADADLGLTPTSRAEFSSDMRAIITQARPVPVGSVLNEIAQAALTVKSDTVLELRLDPAELGQVDIEFTFVDDRLNIAVRGDRDDAVDLMRRNSDELTKMLREANLDLDTLSFSQGERREQQSSEAVTTQSLEDVMPTETMVTLAPDASISGSTRLDIRI